MSDLTSTHSPARAADPRLRRWRLQIFAVTWIAYAGFYFTRQGLSVAKVGILADPAVNTTLTKAFLGDLDAVYLAAYALGQFVWGTLADRLGTRVVVLGGLVLSALASTLMGIIPALVLFAPLMFVQGLAQSAGWSPLCKNVSKFFAVHERGRVLGLWSTNYAFGGLAAAPLLGWVAYGLFDSWRIAFLAGVAVVLAVIVVVVVLQRNEPGDVGLAPIAEPAEPTEPVEPEAVEPAAASAPRRRPSGSARQSFTALRTVLRDRTVVALAASYFLLKPARYAILLWGPVIVIERIPTAGPLEAVVIPVAFGVAGVAAPILIGLVSDKLFGSRRIPPTVLSLIGLVAVLALFVPLTASGKVAVMVALLGLIGLTVYAADAMISCTAAVDFGTSKYAGTATGFVNGCGSIGAILGGLLPGYLGAGALFYTFAGAALLSALLLLPRWNNLPTQA